jgi:hypothetical protein
MYKRIALTIAALALTASPAWALPSQAPDNSGTAHAPSGAPYNGTTNPGATNRAANQPDTPGPGASLPAKARAYGKYCQGQSKQHVAGTPGTPFSKCVTDMAKLANGSTSNPRAACRNESKKHVAGEHGTAFSRCVAGAAKLLRDQRS